jgi:aryl-alcohol dehydrogenase-like predicted oxidoreductase
LLQYIQLGHTPFVVSRICFGVLTIGPLCANMPIKDGAKIIKAALAKGINFFDTAEYYQTYPYLREALKNWQQEVVICSKSYATTVEGIKKSVENARIELDRDRIEIFMLHEQRSAQAIKDNLPLLEYLHQAKAKGLIGAVGISAHDVPAVHLAAQMPEIEVIHPMINKMGVGIRCGTLAQMIEAIELAYANGKGLYGMKAIGGGSLMKNAREMLGWAFSRPYLHAVAIGMKDEAEVATNIAWLQGKEAPEAKNLRLIERNLVVEKFDACHGCGKCVAACPQGALSIVDFQANWHKDKCIFCGYCIPACENFCLSFA